MNKSPPNRKEKFIQAIKRYADDDSHGYSQKPPSGRWGPDYDCSSLIYQAANDAGYPVGTGGDKVRFTGTMLKDFEKAGFQILPFANVGVSDLKIGDILLNLALHAEVYIGEGKTVAATSSETGEYVGEAGDQTGQEIERHPVTTFKKQWDYVLRPPDEDNNQGEELKEGDKEMPMPYGPTPMSQTQGYNPMGQPWQGTMNYPQGSGGYPSYPNQGYPHQGGNLGQMNGYSQAGNQYRDAQHPMSPQGITNDLEFVMGIEGARNSPGQPNSRKAVFDEDNPWMYIVHYGQNGMVDDIRVYKFEECSEEMPQHLSPLMRNNPMNPSYSSQGPSINREEIMQMIKEVMDSESAKSSTQSGNQPRGGQSVTVPGQQPSNSTSRPN